MKFLRGPRALGVAAAVMSGVLLSSALVIRRTVQEASHLVARGVGDGFAFAGQQAFRGAGALPDDAALAEFLETHAEDGLRYVGVLDETGRVIAQAGDSVGGPLADAGVELIGRRARLVHRFRGFRRPFPGPPPPERRWLRIVFEFEPLAALELEAQARRLLGVALLACVGIVGLALAFSRALAQREAMQGELERGRRLAALGSMSAVLAHELRNPLASLKGHAQLLAESAGEDAHLGPKVGRVVSEAVRLERLLNDLLAFVSSGELRRAATDPDEVLRAAVLAVGSPVVDARYLGSAERWSLDGDRLEQALENILRNAVQASAPEQRVEATVERVDKTLLFRVTDHGPGIPPGEEERVFEPFVTGRIKGVGLGLAISRRIVELHGGTLRAENRPGGGAEFRITLPWKEA